VFIINVTYCIVCIVGQSLCFVVQWRRWSQCRAPPLHCWQPLRASLVCLLNANWDASSVADCAICSRPCWPIGLSTRPVGNRRDCFAAKIVKLSSPAWSRYKSAVTSQLNAAFVEPSLKQRSGRCSSDTRWRRWLLASVIFHTPLHRGQPATLWPAPPALRLDAGLRAVTSAYNVRSLSVHRLFITQLDQLGPVTLLLLFCVGTSNVICTHLHQLSVKH